MVRLALTLSLLVASACSTVAVRVPVTRSTDSRISVFVEAHFQTDDALPDTELGIGHACAGRWAQAVDVFSGIVAARTSESSAVRSKAWLNLGLAHLYAHDLIAARAAIEKANDLAPSSELARELADLDRLAAQYGRLRARGPFGV